MLRYIIIIIIKEKVWKKYGEILNGYEGKYQVSNLGRIKALEKIWWSGRGNATKKMAPEMIMKDRIVKSSGYKIIKLTKDKKEKHLYVHKLVAEAFIPNPENKPQVNHIDGNKTNNGVENLEWVTAKENIEKAIETGLIKADGCNSYRSKFSPQDIKEIRTNYKPRDKVWGVKALTQKYNCNRSTIFAILRGKTYKNF